MSGPGTTAGTTGAPGDGLRRTEPAPPVRAVHVGLGNFFRAHQAWYTAHAPDAAEWGIAAFTGRSPDLADAMAAQDGLFTLVTRDADGDVFEVVGAVARAHASTDHEAWLGYLADPVVRVVTLTVTETGYVRGTDGGIDLDRPAVAEDLAALREDPRALVRSVPARLVAGLLARREAGGGPITVVPCDNLPDNGAVVARVVRGLAEALDVSLAAWVDDTVSYATTMVDRITPEPTDADLETVRRETGTIDRAPVVTEPFSEWVISGSFPGGRPRWEDAGATLTDDLDPFEQRKLWLLNGAHSLLAYVGSGRGLQTVADAVADPVCRASMEEWWAAASRHLPQPDDELAGYRAALLDRFANPRMQHRLEQIAMAGSQKLPVRVLPVLRREREAGADLTPTARPLAAWVLHLRGSGATVDDPAADELVGLAAGALSEAVQAVLARLDGGSAAEPDVVAAVVSAAEDLQAV